MPGTEPNLTPPSAEKPEAVVGSAQPGLEIDPLPPTPEPDSTLAAASAQEAPGVMPATTEAAAEAEEIAERDPVPPPANLVEPAIDPPNAGNVEPSAESTSAATPPPAAEKIDLPAATEATVTGATVADGTTEHIAPAEATTADAAGSATPEQPPKKKGLVRRVAGAIANLLPHHEEHTQEPLVQTGYLNPGEPQEPGPDQQRVARIQEVGKKDGIVHASDRGEVSGQHPIVPSASTESDELASK